jgi:hypothetical protein
MSSEFKVIYEEITRLRELVMSSRREDPVPGPKPATREIDPLQVVFQNKLNQVASDVAALKSAINSKKDPDPVLDGLTDCDTVGFKDGKLVSVRPRTVLDGVQDGLLKAKNGSFESFQPALSDLFPLNLNDGDEGVVMVGRGELTSSCLVEKEELFVVKVGEKIDLSKKGVVTSVFVKFSANTISHTTKKYVPAFVRVGDKELVCPGGTGGIACTTPMKAIDSISMSVRAIGDDAVTGHALVLVRTATDIRPKTLH